MWSLTSPHTERVSGPEKFRSSARKDICNSIGQYQKCAYSQHPQHPSVICPQMAP
jgi:hypothetical protein